MNVLVGGAWRPANAVGSFQASDPSTGRLLPERFPVSAWDDALEALAAGRKAAFELAAASPDVLADFLDLFARRVVERAEDLVALAHRETSLPVEPRLRLNELPRTAHQAHQAAAAARDRTWCRATIDSRLNIRSKHGPLGGPVVVFGPSNFPLAFNPVGGGDAVTAIAAGNPVVAKGHPGHPATTRLFAQIALDCLAETGLPRATVQLLHDLRPEDGLRLVAHPWVGATAFTGGRPAGLKLKEAADRAGKPIFLEMSSVNPVFVLPGAMSERGDSIAAELFASCSLGAGQFCTKPGLVVVLEDDAGRAFVETARALFANPPAGYLLGPGQADSLGAAVAEMAGRKAEILAGGSEIEGAGYRFANTLLAVSVPDFLRAPEVFGREAFGTTAVLVLASKAGEMTAVAEVLGGNLAASIYSRAGGEDEALYRMIEPLLRRSVGRLLNDKMPTGLAVVPAMVHGGPFPATGHPGFTSVGIPASILRFTALHGYDNVRPGRLPEALRDKNPTGRMWRFIDGGWTQGDVRPEGPFPA
jgi:NADP-dependent aldehyde dehydrogenase